MAVLSSGGSSDDSSVATQMENGSQGSSHTGSVWQKQGRTLELPTGGPPCQHISLPLLVHPTKMTSAGQVKLWAEMAQTGNQNPSLVPEEMPKSCAKSPCTLWKACWVTPKGSLSRGVWHIHLKSSVPVSSVQASHHCMGNTQGQPCSRLCNMEPLSCLGNEHPILDHDLLHHHHHTYTTTTSSQPFLPAQLNDFLFAYLAYFLPLQII